MEIKENAININLACVVVLYKPNLDEVKLNIGTYLDFVKKLYVVINESSNLIVDSLAGYDKLCFIENYKNLGIAKALNQGAERAILDGYNWLLTMDQDSSFYDSSFFDAFLLTDKFNVALFSPNHSIEHFENIGDYDVDKKQRMVMTSGNIINLNIWEKLKGFEDKLFIDCVDNDYCLKVCKNGLEIVVFKNIYLNHNLGELKVVNFFNKRFHVSQHNPIRTYYIFRNNLYLFMKYGSIYPRVIFNKSIDLIKEFMWIILVQKNRIRHLKSIFWGVVDFTRNKYGSLD